MKSHVVLYFFSLVFLLGPGAIYAQEESRSKVFLRKLLGTKVSSYILGSTSEGIELPPIPTIKNEATSTKVYDKKEASLTLFDKLTPDERKKYNYSFVKELHQAVKNRSASDQDTAHFVNILTQGASREGVYRAIVLDSGHSQLEVTRETATTQTQEFLRDYMDRFLRIQMKDDVLSSTNIYVLKRVVVEKSLEVMDKLKENEEHWLNWYAVLSSDLAKKFTSLWEGKLRGNTSRKIHKDWAQSVPEQHVKSEVIIKLHTALNYLQKLQ